MKQRPPHLTGDGEMQADTAVVPEIIDQTYPFSTRKGGANVLVFPNLEAGNVAYAAGAAGRGGGDRSDLDRAVQDVHVLQRGAEVNDIVNVAAVAVVDAQESERHAWYNVAQMAV